MKTIARTATRKIAAIAATVTGVKVYDQATGNFQPSTVDAAFTTLRSNKNARLVDMENGTYNVNVHSNYWYVLTTTPVAEVEQPATEVTPATGTGSLAAASARTVAGVRAARTRVTDSAEAETCGQRWVAEIGLRPRCRQNAAAHTDANNAPRDEQVSRDAEARLGYLRAADDAAEMELPGFTARRAALLRIAEHGGAVADDALETGMGDALVRAGMVQRVVGPGPDGYVFTAHGRLVADLLKEFPAYGDFVRKYTLAEVGEKIAAEYGDALAVLGQEETGEDANPFVPFAFGKLLRIHDTRHPLESGARTVRGADGLPLAVGPIAEAQKLCAELWAAETTRNMDVRAKAHPYRPAVGEWVVGIGHVGGAATDVIGMFQGVKRSWMGDGFDYADLEDFNGTVLAADPDSLRPAPKVPDAAHLIGRKITAELTAGLRGDSRTGIVSRVLRPSADGEYVVVQFETGWIVRVPVAVVEDTAPKPAKLTELSAEKATGADGVEHWNVRARVRPKPTMVNLTITAPPLPAGETEPTPYAAVDQGGGVFQIHDTRFGPSADDRIVRWAQTGTPLYVKEQEAWDLAEKLWALEVAGDRESGDRL